MQVDICVFLMTWFGGTELWLCFDVVWMCICRLTLDLCGELLGLIPSLVRSLRPVLLTGLQQSGKRYVSN